MLSSTSPTPSRGCHVCNHDNPLIPKMLSELAFDKEHEVVQHPTVPIPVLPNDNTTTTMIPAGQQLSERTPASSSSFLSSWNALFCFSFEDPDMFYDAEEIHLDYNREGKHILCKEERELLQSLRGGGQQHNPGHGNADDAYDYYFSSRNFAENNILNPKHIGARRSSRQIFTSQSSQQRQEQHLSHSHYESSSSSIQTTTKAAFATSYIRRNNQENNSWKHNSNTQNPSSSPTHNHYNYLPRNKNMLQQEQQYYQSSQPRNSLDSSWSSFKSANDEVYDESIEYPPPSPSPYTERRSSHASHYDTNDKHMTSKNDDYGCIFPPPPPKQLPLRFLRAGKGDPVEGQRRYDSTLSWRKEHNIDTILLEAHPNFQLIKQHYPHYYHLRGYNGEPVFFEQPPKTNLQALRDGGVDLHSLVRHYVMVTEFGWQYVEPNDMARSITVLDLEGMRMMDFVGECVEYVKMCSQFTGQHYPERAGHVIVVNVPRWFSMIWNVVKPMVDEVTLRKISIVRGKNDVFEALAAKIPVENIPPEYGGKSMPLGQSPEEQELAALMAHNDALANGDFRCGGRSANPPCRFCSWGPVRSY